MADVGLQGSLSRQAVELGGEGVSEGSCLWVRGGENPLAQAAAVVYTKGVPDTYNIKEAQAELTKLCRAGRKFVIANRNRPVFVALPVDDFEALIETMDVLADPQAMKVMRDARSGKASYHPLDLDDENFGL